MLHWFTPLKRACLMFGLIVALSLVGAADAFAQRKGKNDYLLENTTAKSYVGPYALVGLGIVLGLLLVVRPSTRQDKVKVRSAEEGEDLQA